MKILRTTPALPLMVDASAYFLLYCAKETALLTWGKALTIATTVYPFFKE